MRNSILGFKQESLCRLGMNMDDAMILRYFVDFVATGKMVTYKHKGETYYWIKYHALIESLPILSVSKDRIYRKLKNLVKIGVLKHITVKENGTYSFYTFGHEFPSLEIPSPVDGKNDTLPLKKPQDSVEKDGTKDNSFNHYSFKENDSYKNLYINIVQYLNCKTQSNYSPLCKNTQELIYSRFMEGFTEQDFKTVIDKKVTAWQHTDMCKYLRPKTLFGNKFEGYLNEIAAPFTCKNTFVNYAQRNYDFESLERKLLGWE